MYLREEDDVCVNFAKLARRLLIFVLLDVYIYKCEIFLIPETVEL